MEMLEGGVDAQIGVLLTSALFGSELSASRPFRITSEGEPSGALRIGG
jgi:hypothetical protein